MKNSVLTIFSGKTYNGECINRRGVDGSSIGIKHNDYYTYNSTHIEDCSNYCKAFFSSGDYTTSNPRPRTTTGYYDRTHRPRPEPTQGPRPTPSATTYWYRRSLDKDEEAEVQANGQQEFQYFGWENYGRSKLISFDMTVLLSRQNDF